MNEVHFVFLLIKDSEEKLTGRKSIFAVCGGVYIFLNPYQNVNKAVFVTTEKDRKA